MCKEPLAKEKPKGQFTGHETFPLRHLWLPKAYKKVASNRNRNRRGSPFSDKDAIVTFGVGKNMVNSIRHWALACRIIKTKNEGTFEPDYIGKFLFDRKTGKDPFMEKKATLWLIHWMVAGHGKRTSTWHYAFNDFPERKFERENITTAIKNLCKDRGWKRVSNTTIKRDVECFIRSYVYSGDQKTSEDSMESVLSELPLIRTVGTRLFEFNYGPKPSLPEGVFLYSLNEFWNTKLLNQNSASVETLTYASGSPGRVFKIDEQSLVKRLVNIGKNSEGRFEWTDTSGIRNVTRLREERDSIRLLELAYKNS